MKWLEKVNPAVHWAYTCQHDRGWVEPLRVIYDHELVLIRRGMYVSEIEGERFLCNAGDFLIIPPDRQHVSWDQGQKPGVRLCVHFDWTTCYPLLDDICLDCYHPGIPDQNRFRMPPGFVPKKILQGQVQDFPQANELFNRLESHFLYGSEHHRVLTRALLMELLLEILDKTSRKPQPILHRPLESIARDLLAKLAFMPVDAMPPIEDVFEQLDCSYAHICRRFKQRFSVSPLTYVTTIRINNAKQLLHDNDISIAHIANKTGYNDPAYFSRMFRKHTGLSPKQYQKKNT